MSKQGSCRRRPEAERTNHRLMEGTLTEFTLDDKTCIVSPVVKHVRLLQHTGQRRSDYATLGAFDAKLKPPVKFASLEIYHVTYGRRGKWGSWPPYGKFIIK